MAANARNASDVVLDIWSYCLSPWANSLRSG